MLLLILKEHFKTLSLGIRGMSLYATWVLKALNGIIFKSIILLLFLIGPISIWVTLFLIVFDIIRYRL